MQKQFTTYQADILSFELREALMGVIRPGRFSGFDQIAADGTPAGGTIYLILSHSANGVAKLPKSAGSLDPPIGVAMTTQGTLIHEDDTTIDIDIPDNSGSGSIRWYVIYMEHDYVEVQGANNAIYSFISGTPGAGIPALTEAYHRIPIGYIRADGLATSISGLTYFPANSILAQGDDKLNEMLWGTGDGASKFFNKLNEAGADVGVIPSDGAIGQRDYTVGYFITDYESITDSLEAIDLQLHTFDLEMTAVEGTKLDDWATPDDNTDLDATAARHGLLPKLPDDADYFLDGVGSWKDIHTYIDQMVWDNSPSWIFDYADIVASGGTLDLSPYVPVGTKAVILDVYGMYDDANTGSQIFRIWKGGYSASGGPGLLAGNTSQDLSNHAMTQMTIPISSSRTIVWSTGAISHWSYMSIKLLGWII